MKCKKCNAEIPENATICLNCFSEVGNKKTHNIRKKLVLGFLPICCAFILSAVFVLFPSRTEDSYGVPDTGGEVSVSGETSGGALKTEDKKESDGIFSIFKKDDEKNTENGDNKNFEETTESEKSTGFWSTLFKKPDEKEKDGTAASSTERNSEENITSTKSESAATTEGTTNANIKNDTTTAATTAGTTATTGADSDNQNFAPKENPADVFEYGFYGNTGKKISITKYTGSASYVTVPDYIDGLMVVELSTGAFKDNPSIKTVDVVKGDRSYIWFREKCFDNCSSLETINLYNNDLGLDGEFAVDCPI